MSVMQLWKPLNTPYLLAADIDGTLLSDEDGDEGELAFKALVENHPRQVILAMVTGRSLPSIEPLIQAGRLPQPDYICADVGTELIDCRDPHNELGRRYEARVSPDWNLEEIYRRGYELGFTMQDMPDGLPRFQAAFDWDGRSESLQALRQRLADLPDCAIIPSYDCYIDVVPAVMGKGQAVLFLQEALGLDWEHVVVAGDAGNDRAMFENGLRGILPANALDELILIANQPWHYYSPFPSALGVLDGLRHFGLISPDAGK